MKHVALLLCLALLTAGPARAQEPPAIVRQWQDNPVDPVPATEADLTAFRYIARAIVVMSDSPFNPKFREQLNALEARPEPLIDRDVVIITDSDPSAGTALRERLRPHGFSLVLISKEGVVELRKPFPQSVRELSAAIDKMPLRQKEVEDG